MSPDVQLLSALASLRRRWRPRVFLESLGVIVVAALLAVIAAVLLTRYTMMQRRRCLPRV